MGKQIEFYMTPLDEVRFVTAIQATSDVAVVKSYFPTTGVVELDVAELHESVNREGFGSLFLINNDIHSKVIIESADPDRYTIALSESEVIEFRRWTILRNDGRKEPGRLWYDHERMNCKPKREAFLSWAQSVFRHIKKHYHRSKKHGGRYFGPDAWEQFEQKHMTLAPY